MCHESEWSYLGVFRQALFYTQFLHTPPWPACQKGFSRLLPLCVGESLTALQFFALNPGTAVETADCNPLWRLPIYDLIGDDRIHPDTAVTAGTTCEGSCCGRCFLSGREELFFGPHTWKCTLTLYSPKPRKPHWGNWHWHAQVSAEHIWLFRFSVCVSAHRQECTPSTTNSSCVGLCCRQEGHGSWPAIVVNL